MPIRNLFGRRPGAPPTNDENVRPGSVEDKSTLPAFERVDTVGSKASSALSSRSAKSQDTGEYKMSGTALCLLPRPAAQAGRGLTRPP
jgi:hypothetical protein